MHISVILNTDVLSTDVIEAVIPCDPVSIDIETEASIPLANGANCIFFFISTKFRHFPYFRKNYTFPLFPQNLPLFGLITAFCFHLIVTCFTRRPRLPDASESSDRLDRCFKMTQLLMHGRGKGTMAVQFTISCSIKS